MSAGTALEANHNGLKFMRDSDWRMGALFACFVLVMLVFDKIIHTIEHRLHDDPTKKGLRHAVKRFKTELLAVGVVSLLLVALTEPLTKICLPGGTHHSESALAHLASGPAHSTDASHAPASADALHATPAEPHAAPADSHAPTPAESHNPAAPTTKAAPAPHTTTEPHTPAPKASAAGHTPAPPATDNRRRQFRHLLSSGSASGEGEGSCNHLFDEHTIHNAHLLLFLIAVVNIAYGVATLVIGVLTVEQFRKRPTRYCGLLSKGKLSVEEDVADDDYLKPLKRSLAKDIEKYGHSWLWRLWWAFKRQFTIIGDERVVTKDLYMATRSCAFDFLNTVRFHVLHGGKVKLAAGQHLPPPSLPCTRPSPKTLPASATPATTTGAAPDARLSHDQATAGGDNTKLVAVAPVGKGEAQQERHHHRFLHRKYDLKAAAGKVHRMHLGRHMDFVGLVRVAVEIVFTKETNSEWILPLLMAVLFAIPHTPVLLVALVSLQLAVNLVLGIKMQSILLHMAIRYHHKHRVWSRWVAAKKRALQALHNSNGASRSVEAPAEHAVVPIEAGHHKRAPVEHFHKGLTKDASTLFWCGWPDLVRIMMEISYFTNSLVLALLLFVAWEGRKAEPHIFQETWRFWTVALALTAANFIHLSFMVMPAYALLTTTGRHVPLELIQAVRHPGTLQALYAIRGGASKRQGSDKGV